MWAGVSLDPEAIQPSLAYMSCQLQLACCVRLEQRLVPLFALVLPCRRYDVRLSIFLQRVCDCWGRRRDNHAARQVAACNIARLWMNVASDVTDSGEH